MKKCISVLCLLLVAVLCCTPVVSAARVDSEPLGKVYAVATTESGKTAKIAAPDAEDIDRLAEYELYVAQEPVLSVGSTAGEAVGAAAPAYYHVQFMLPGTTEEVYLTGLRAEYVEQIQQAILDNILSGVSFDLTDLGFIDTEKTAAEDDDESLCWAAATSNVLTYTGWAAQAGYKNTDDVFELFIRSFTNNGGNELNGLAWFFNGAALRMNLGLTAARIRNYPYSGNYMKTYAYDMVSENSFVESAADMHRMDTLLRSGYGVCLGIMMYDTQGHSGGHAITLWGMVTDTALDASDPKRYKSVFVTDSDSHFADGDRRSAEDVMTLYPLDTTSGFAFRYYDDVTAVLDEYTALVPYSYKVPHETDSTSRLYKTNYPDLAIGRQFLQNEKALPGENKLLESGSSLSFGCTVANTSDKRYRANATLDVTLTDQNGKKLFTQSKSNYTSLSYAEETTPYMFSVSKVPAGDYTLQYTVNKQHNVTEAFYYNNVRTTTFKVRDSYLCGDFNGDGAVTIDDATAVQRYLSEMDSASEKAKERGNVNGGIFNIADVTELQRWIADLTTDSPIGEKLLHTGI